jgi:hypothetical protein
LHKQPLKLTTCLARIILGFVVFCLLSSFAVGLLQGSGYWGFDLPKNGVIYDHHYGQPYFSAFRVNQVRFANGCVYQGGKLFPDCKRELYACEQFVNGSNQIGLISFYNPPDEFAVTQITSSNVVHVVSKDSGETWTAFMSTSGWMNSPECSDYAFYDDNFIWVTHLGLLAFTHDGGSSWSFWNTSMVNASTVRYPQSPDIETINFINEDEGIMTVCIERNYAKPCALLTLQTRDGRFTWNEQ